MNKHKILIYLCLILVNACTINNSVLARCEGGKVTIQELEPNDNLPNNAGLPVNANPVNLIQGRCVTVVGHISPLTNITFDKDADIFDNYKIEVSQISKIRIQITADSTFDSVVLLVADSNGKLFANGGHTNGKSLEKILTFLPGTYYISISGSDPDIYFLTLELIDDRPTYSCDPGFNLCPNSISPLTCCSYGCCPSNPNECLCSTGNGQCTPNCSLATPTPTITNSNPTAPESTPTPGSDSQTLKINAPSLLTLSMSGNNSFRITVNGSGFNSRSSCQIVQVKARTVQARPSTFLLTSSNGYTKEIKIDFLKSALSRIFREENSFNVILRITCNNGANINFGVKVKVP